MTGEPDVGPMPRRVAPTRPPVLGSIGILGGTFDPVHVGHLAVAEEAREALGLERVLFVPAGLPPHKVGRSISPPEHRVAMVRLAIADNPAFGLSRIEVDREGPSFTVDTVAELLAAPATDGTAVARLTVIVSAELFGTLRTWHRPERLLELARLAVVPRGGYPPPSRAYLGEHFPGREDRVDFLDGPHLDVSATEIRARAAAGRSVRYLVPLAVSDYIRDHALYSDPSWWKN
jgi:nicotinate-nucleotide adenylyltransferase